MMVIMTAKNASEKPISLSGPGSLSVIHSSGYRYHQFILVYGFSLNKLRLVSFDE
jgi:hypothetical protein